MCARVVTRRLRTRRKGSFGIISALKCWPRKGDDDISLIGIDGRKTGSGKGQGKEQLRLSGDSVLQGG